MRVPTDLHEDDPKSRLLLVDELRAVREEMGITTETVDAALGVSPGSTRSLERRTTWENGTIFRYARTLGRRLRFIVVDLAPPNDDIMAIVLAAGDTSTPERADRVHWRQVCNELRAIRRARFTAVDMARRLGVTENAVHYWETNPDGSTITSAQRYTRALGGHLGWELDKTLPLVAPRPRPGR